MDAIDKEKKKLQEAFNVSYEMKLAIVILDPYLIIPSFRYLTGRKKKSWMHVTLHTIVTQPPPQTKTHATPNRTI